MFFHGLFLCTAHYFHISLTLSLPHVTVEAALLRQCGSLLLERVFGLQRRVLNVVKYTDTPVHITHTIPTGHTTLVQRCINVNDVDSTSQQRRLPSGKTLRHARRQLNILAGVCSASIEACCCTMGVHQVKIRVITHGNFS